MWGKRRQAEHRWGDGEGLWSDQPPTKKYKKYKCPTTRVTLTNSSLSKIFIVTHVLLLSLNPSLQLFLVWLDLVVQRGIQVSTEVSRLEKGAGAVVVLSDKQPQN